MSEVEIADPVRVPMPVWSGALTVCTICMEEFADWEAVRVLQLCGHGYHKRCVDAWLMKKAPRPSSPPLPPLIHDAVDAVVGADIPHAADAAHVADAADVDYAADTTWMTPGGSPAANVLMRSPGPDLFLWLVSKDLIRVALSITRN